MLADYEELADGFQPIIKEEIFLWVIKCLVIHFEFLAVTGSVTINIQKDTTRLKDLGLEKTSSCSKHPSERCQEQSITSEPILLKPLSEYGKKRRYLE